MSRESIMKGRKRPLEPKLLHRFFEEMVDKNPDSTALIFEDEDKIESRITYRDLNIWSNRIANKILQIVKDDQLYRNKDSDWIVCLCMKPSINLIIAMLATWKAGGAYLTIDVDHPENRIRHIMEEASPLMVFHDEEFEHPEYFNKKNAKKALRKAFVFKYLKSASEEMSADNVPDEATFTKAYKNMAMIIYTSGSTGLAKGVRVLHLNAQNRLEWYWNEHPFADDETHFIFKSSVIFIDHFGEMWNPLLAGKTVVIVSREFTRNPERLVPILEKYKIQRLIGVPTLLRGILLYLQMIELNQQKPKLPHLRIWINSGEALNLQLVNEFFEYFKDGKHLLGNFYGATELMADVITYVIESKDQLKGFESVPIGKASDNTVVYILDENKIPVHDGEVGEIYVAGGFVCGGYVNDIKSEGFKKNHLTLVPAHWLLYQTGDFGMMKDGVIFYHGRRDNQIKIDGHRVEISEIENTLSGLHFIEKSSIQVFHRGAVDQAVLGFVTIKRTFAFVTAKDIASELSLKLPSYMLPQIIVLNRFPYLSNGKVNVQELMRNYGKTIKQKQETPNVQMDFKDVSKDTLETVQKVFQIIGKSISSNLHDKISIASNFFEIGGNSLNTILCVNQLRKENFDISIADFLKAKNIAEILVKLDIRKPGRPSIIDFTFEPEMDVHSEPLNMERMDECIGLLASSIYEKGVLEQFVKDLKIDHFVEFLTPNWEFFVNGEVSFMVLDEENRIVGVSLNHELGDEPKEISASSPLETMINYLSFVQQDVVSKKLSNNSSEKILESLMMGTSKDLNSKDNIHVVSFMENRILNMAKEQNFSSICTTNTNQLTQQIDESVLGYKVLKEFQINRYVDKYGKRPFKEAQDHQKTITMWKDIED